MRQIASFGHLQFEIETTGPTTLAYVTTADTAVVRQLQENDVPVEFSGAGDGGQSQMKNFLAERFGEPTGPWKPSTHTAWVKGEPFDVAVDTID